MEAVRCHALAAWGQGGSFLDRLIADDEVGGVIDGTALAAFFDPAHHLQNVDTIFERVFGRS